MKHLPSFILILFIFSCSTEPNQLNGKVETSQTQNEEEIDSAKFLIDKGALTARPERLKLSYAGISCPCADWFETKNADKEGDLKEHFYLEPGDTTLIQADTLFNGEYFPVQISVTGRFYTKEGYPKNYFPAKGDPKPARVFRYTSIEIIQRGQPLVDVGR